MILDKLFLSFSFLMIIGLLVAWIWAKLPCNANKNVDMCLGVMVLLDLIWFAGFVLTGILAIWF